MVTIYTISCYISIASGTSDDIVLRLFMFMRLLLKDKLVKSPLWKKKMLFQMRHFESCFFTV